jgi:hypothetical protein
VGEEAEDIYQLNIRYRAASGHLRWERRLRIYTVSGKPEIQDSLRSPEVREKAEDI